MNEPYAETIGSGKSWFALLSPPEDSILNSELNRYLGPLGFTRYYFAITDSRFPRMIVGVEGDIAIHMPLDNFFNSLAYAFDIPVLFGTGENATLCGSSPGSADVPSLEAAYEILAGASADAVSLLEIKKPHRMGHAESNIRHSMAHMADLGIEQIPALAAIDLRLNRQFRTPEEIAFLEKVEKKITSEKAGQRVLEESAD